MTRKWLWTKSSLGPRKAFLSWAAHHAHWALESVVLTTKRPPQAILTQKYKGLTSMVLCFEDACKEEEVPAAEQNSLHLLDMIGSEIACGNFSEDDLPLIFFRVRNVEQFKHFGAMLKPEHLKLITGFNFPKFNMSNAGAYLTHLQDMNDEYGEILYGMPIIEDRRVAFKETRMQELLGIRKIVDEYKDLILNIRVGGTDGRDDAAILSITVVMVAFSPS